MRTNPLRDKEFFKAIVVRRGLNLVVFWAFRKKTNPPLEGVTTKKVIRFFVEEKRKNEMNE